MSNTQDNNPPSASVLVEITVDHKSFEEPPERVAEAARITAHLHGRSQGLIEITIVSDATIHSLNRQRLEHDWPTDVISFVYHDNAPQIEGEIIVSWDTAQRVAEELRVDAMSELLLYVVHGTLHLCGLGDHSELEQQVMRAAETDVLQALGLDAPRSLGVRSC